MKLLFKACLYGSLMAISFSCKPFDKIARHDFNSGYYRLKTEDKKATDVYTGFTGDTIKVYSLTDNGNSKIPEKLPFAVSSLDNIIPGNYFYKSCFSRNSVDVDLTTVILKYRPPAKGVPNQLSANLNGAIYVGFRKNFYRLIPSVTPLNEESSYLKQVSFDAGLFGGLGITPINPTVTANNITQEYDGMVFQKGVATFLTVDNISIGIALGFDNLLDKNKSVWIYNQKPYIGLLIGISNF
jgi:hypothetical protein